MRSLILSFISICLVSALSRKHTESFFPENPDLIDFEQSDTYFDDSDLSEELDIEEDGMNTEREEIVDEYPFMVKIYGETVCTGVRYKDDIILTTASCAQGKVEDYTGVWGFGNGESVEDHFGYEVQRVIPHPKYAIDSRAYDVAIIQIEVDMRRPQYNYFELTSDHSISQPGAELKVLIREVDSYSDEYSMLNQVIHSLPISVLNVTSCGDLASQLHPLLEFCAGFSGYYGGFYEQHVGSPAFIQNENSITIVGLFTQTDEEDDGIVPAEFTRLSQFRRWIDKTIEILYTEGYEI